jgi:diguanylate cyclase (GGDEF)-like protein
VPSHPGASPEFWRNLAQSVALAADEGAAFTAVTQEISRAFAVPTWIVDTAAHGHRIVAEAGRHVPPDVDDMLRRSVVTASFPQADGAAPSPIDLGASTAIPLLGASSSTVLVVGGKAETFGPILAEVAVWLPGALRAVRERSQIARVDALLVDVYKLTRRTGRSGAIEAVCQQVVDQASRTIGAERVAVALYKPEEHQLALAAACGYPLADVKDVRIQPGEWVMGHVYSCRRAVVVRDVRRIHAVSTAPQRYRTVSFAAVPIVAESRVVGVLSATDKTDGGVFTRQDVAAMRAISGVASLGLVAARREAETVRLTHAATIDSLTGLFNRQSFDVRLREEIERAKRSSGSLAVLMIDVDDYKAINDTYGHPVGDAVLQAASDVLRSVVRVFDFCARYGGDEFAVVMPNSDSASTSAAAERIRERISVSYERDARLIGLRRVTVSVGAATMQVDDTAEEIVQRADDSLYRAKAAGKNCVRIAPAPTPAQLPPSSPGRPKERSPRR